MMRWILAGAVLGLLIAYPSLLAVVAAAVAVMLSKPAVVAFVFGVTAGLRSPRLRRWAR
ncbi:hypothetical protein [Streptomyces sp. NPDC087856]|uniref:hypothetical protein n=1 Tax=Streptomyces sp. NPDC087856 TaxID=3365811 RepID=UPI00382C5DFE